MKRVRNADDKGPVRKRARHGEGDPHPLLDLPLELVTEVHQHMDAPDRAHLQQTCHTCYDWDPGLILPIEMAAYVQQFQAALGPHSPFAVEKITFAVECLESFPAQYNYINVRAHITAEQTMEIALPGCRQIMWNEAICGMYHVPPGYAEYRKYYTMGGLDSAKLKDQWRRNRGVALPSDDDDDETRPDPEPTAAEMEALMRHVRAKDKMRRLLMGYQHRQGRARMVWEATNTIPMRVTSVRRLQSESRRFHTARVITESAISTLKDVKNQLKQVVIVPKT
jgi:hypothetical protein